MTLAWPQIPVGQMPGEALPPPTSWSRTDGLSTRVDGQGSAPLLGRDADPNVREETWEMSWDGIGLDVAASIRAHFRDWRGQFSWRNPETGAVEAWRHAAPPSINFASATSASARATLIRLAARE
jgi:hypothetical protein